MYFIGIDTSTTATKALLMDESGQVLGVASNEYPYEIPQPLWSEQDPALWWLATGQSIRQVVAQTGVDAALIRGIGLTGQMHGLVLLNERGEVLRPSILWNDQRTGLQCDAIRARLGREHLIQVTGNDALTGFTAPKILWVQENEPEIWKRVRHILLPKDYVRYKLTGEFAIDRADGAGTILFDLPRPMKARTSLARCYPPWQMILACLPASLSSAAAGIRPPAQSVRVPSARGWSRSAWEPRV